MSSGGNSDATGNPAPVGNAPGPGAPQPRRTDRRVWLSIVLALLLLVLSGLVVDRLRPVQPTTSPDALISVPNFVGRSLDDARAVAGAVGLELVPAGPASSEPTSTVVAQDPPPGVLVARGSSVTVTVIAAVSPSPVSSPAPSASETPVPTGSRPPTGGLSTVGDYRCLTLADATDRLTRDGFRLGTVNYTFSGGPADKTWLVEKQAPASGERVPARSAINLTLSSPFTVCPG